MQTADLQYLSCLYSLLDAFTKICSLEVDAKDPSVSRSFVGNIGLLQYQIMSSQRAEQKQERLIKEASTARKPSMIFSRMTMFDSFPGAVFAEA